MSLDPVAKTLFVLGVLLIFIAVAWQMGWIQSLRIGRLPGDIYIDRDGMKVYIPITTSLLISVLLSLVAWIVRTR